MSNRYSEEHEHQELETSQAAFRSLLTRERSNCRRISFGRYIKARRIIDLHVPTCQARVAVQNLLNFFCGRLS